MYHKVSAKNVIKVNYTIGIRLPHSFIEVGFIKGFREKSAYGFANGKETNLKLMIDGIDIGVIVDGEQYLLWTTDENPIAKRIDDDNLSGVNHDGGFWGSSDGGRTWMPWRLSDLIVGVQPMTEPSGNILTVKPKYLDSKTVYK